VTIALVIGTHGWAAEPLLKTAEMLLGEQHNVACIDFAPGENAETLMDKYRARLAELDTAQESCFWRIHGEAARLMPPAVSSRIARIRRSLLA